MTRYSSSGPGYVRIILYCALYGILIDQLPKPTWHLNLALKSLPRIPSTGIRNLFSTIWNGSPITSLLAYISGYGICTKAGYFFNFRGIRFIYD